MRYAITIVAFLLSQVCLAAEQRQIENVETFARLYGYVRFFHPSYEGSETDWRRFALYGSEQMLTARDSAELLNSLRAIFGPVAPTMTIYTGTSNVPLIVPDADVAPSNPVAWQHFGVRLSERSNVYQSARVFLNSSNDLLFPEKPKPNEVFEAMVGRDIRVRLPLVLDAAAAKSAGRGNASFSDFANELSAIEIDDRTPDELAVRLANITIAWNVIQHFYPYFDVVDVDWNEVLRASIAEALDAQVSQPVGQGLKMMIARLGDGHGAVSVPGEQGMLGRPAVTVREIDNQFVVLTTADGSMLSAGDIVLEVDGRPAREEFQRQRELVSGSSRLRDYRATNMFAAGPRDRAVWFKVLRAGGNVELVELDRSVPAAPFGPPALPEMRPSIREVRDGTYLVHTALLTKEEFAENIDRLADAKAVILDVRLGSNRGLNLISDVVPHLTRESVRSPQWLVPHVIYPDHRNMTFEPADWLVEPQSPYWSGRKIVITGPGVVSAGETFIGLIDHYSLAETVGATTAGVNGNVNFIPLIGGLDVMWTGMKVLHQDGTQHHLLGYEPDYPVEATIEGARNEQDEVLETAIEIATAPFFRDVRP